MKAALKQTSWPALTELRQLLLPGVEAILAQADQKLRDQRRFIRDLGRFRDGILKAAVAIEPPESVATIEAAETETAGDLSGLDRNGLRLMARNRQIAEKAELPEPERLGIEEANLMRLLVGLSALELDPALCEAARDHSGDMATLKFFSHTSPVAGKTSFTDRARRAGTSASGENIYMGSRDPKGANKGWFFSPGHHKNMFNPGHRRIGLGNSGTRWTQMFGR